MHIKSIIAKKARVQYTVLSFPYALSVVLYQQSLVEGASQECRSETEPLTKKKL